MRDWLFLQFILVSITSVPIILLLKLLANKLNKVYVAKWKYWLWLVLAVRLLVPWSPSLPVQPVEIMIPNSVVSEYETSDSDSVVWAEDIKDSMMAEYPAVEQQVPTMEEGNLFVEEKDTISEQRDNPVMTSKPEVLAGERALEMPDILILAEWLWLTVAVICLGYHIAANLFAGRRLRRWSRLADDALLNQVSAVLGEEGIPKHLTLLVGPQIAGPMVVGLLQPKLYLPEKDYSNKELQFILQHELTHYFRKDLWYKALFLIVNIVHWFNPFVYLMCREAEKDLESSCDSMVVSGAGKEMRCSYAHLILDEAACKNVNKRLLTSNFHGGTEDMKRRLQNIMDTGKKKNGIVTFAVLIAISIGIGGLIGFKLGQSDARQIEVQEVVKQEVSEEKIIGEEESIPEKELPEVSMPEPEALSESESSTDKKFESPITFLDENLIQNVDKSQDGTYVRLGTGDCGRISAWHKEGVTEPFYELEYGEDIHYEIEDGVLKCVVGLYQGLDFYRGKAELPYIYENGEYVIDRDRTMLYLDWGIDTAARNSLWQHSQIMEEVDGLQLDGGAMEDRLTLHRVVDGSVAHNVLTVYLDNGLTASYKLPSNYVTMNDDSHIYHLPMQSDYYQTIIVQLSDPDLSRPEASTDYYVLHVEMDEESRTAQIVEDVAILDGMMDSENYPQHQDTFLGMPFYNVTHYGDNGPYYHEDLEKVTLRVTGLTEEEVCYVYWDGEAWKTYTE